MVVDMSTHTTRGQRVREQMNTDGKRNETLNTSNVQPGRRLRDRGEITLKRKKHGGRVGGKVRR